MTASVDAPRSPKAHWLFGHSVTFSRDQIGYLTWLAREYGDIVPLKLPPYRVVFLNQPDLIHQILVAKQRAFRKGIVFRRMGELLGQGLLTSELDYWRRQRTLIQPNFHRQHVAGYGAAMVARTESMIGEWRDGEQREIQHEMLHLTLGIVCDALFGIDLTDQGREIGQAFDEALQAVNDRIRGLEIVVPAWMPLPPQIRLWRARRRLDTMVYAAIRERRAGGDRHDLVSMLIAVREEGGDALSDLQIRDEIITIAAAGHETSALMLTWTWYLLAQHPDVEARLLAELHDVLGDRSPTIEDLSRLTYTNQIVSESLRLYPPIWVIPRVAVEDVEIGGQLVRKGTVVIVSPWTIQRDARYFERPLSFEPERWSDGLAGQLPRFAYFPFGGGPRQCIGAAFATMEATLLIATIARRFRLEVVPGQTVGLDAIVSLRAKPGIKVTLRQR